MILLTLPDGHLHRTNRHLTVLKVVHPPAHSRVKQIQDDAPMQLALLGFVLLSGLLELYSISSSFLDNRRPERAKLTRQQLVRPK